MVVPVIAIVNRDDRVIIAVIEVLRCRWLVVVAVTVSNTRETIGFCRIARSAVPWKCRVGAERAREGRHATYDLGCQDLVRRGVLLDPLHERGREIGGVGPRATDFPTPGWRNSRANSCVRCKTSFRSPS